MSPEASSPLPLHQFGCLTFHLAVMEKRLSKEAYASVLASMEKREKINPLYVDTLANAIKNWAIDLGASYFCHWFQPLTGKSAEKQDAFLDWDGKGKPIQKFSAAMLFKGEPDASSFPSGGMRKTSAARGYSSWDAQTPPFLWKVGDVITLCIPAVFFSWCGKALDMKIPLIRSEEKLGSAALRLLHLLEVKASQVHPTLGCEQEYFLIPKKLLPERPDLQLTGRTLFGSPSIKGQELEDHYFASIPENVIHFMKEVEERAFTLGIPLKTRHCEVAPQQYEVAPLFERGVPAVDHNLMLMRLMEEVAKKHDLVSLFHEKPFAGINGSGKHCNWSLQTDTGINLLDPGLLSSDPLLFLASLTTVIAAVHRHAALLRASIGSAGNDHRLGGNEAPPALISIYLGEEIEKLLEGVVNQREYAFVGQVLKNVGIPCIPDLSLDTMDRNRTSPFVFTGNKFEFRSVGSSAHPGGAVLVLNAIVAESFNKLVDEIQKEKSAGTSTKEAALKVIQKTLLDSLSIRYLGDNYKDDWKEEAFLRGLPNIERSLHSFQCFIEEKTATVFEGILSLEERRARVAIFENTYAHIIQNEAKLMIELFSTQIIPSCFTYQTLLAQNIHVVQEMVGGLTIQTKELLVHLSETVQRAMGVCKELELELSKANSLESSAQSYTLCDIVVPKMEHLRKEVDALERMVQDTLWPLPKYRTLLFSL